MTSFGPQKIVLGPLTSIHSYGPDRYINCTIFHYTPVNCQLLFKSVIKYMESNSKVQAMYLINQTITVCKKFNGKLCMKQVLSKKIRVQCCSKRKILAQAIGENKNNSCKPKIRQPPPPPPPPTTFLIVRPLGKRGRLS